LRDEHLDELASNLIYRLVDSGQGGWVCSNLDAIKPGNSQFCPTSQPSSRAHAGHR
jgi:hypothetical protein